MQSIAHASLRVGVVFASKLFGALGSASAAIEFYVAPNGSDAASGAVSQPVHYIAGDYENGDGAVAVWPVTYSDQARSIPGHLAFINADRIVRERNRFERLGYRCRQAAQGKRCWTK